MADINVSIEFDVLEQGRVGVGYAGLAGRQRINVDSLRTLDWNVAQARTEFARTDRTIDRRAYHPSHRSTRSDSPALSPSPEQRRTPPISSSPTHSSPSSLFSLSQDSE